MTLSWLLALAELTDQWRDELGRRGFADDGSILRGPLLWSTPDGNLVTATIEIEPNDRFPFAPPHVRVLDPGNGMELTFHIDRPTPGGTTGNLCLWEEVWPVEAAPWLDVSRLLERVSGWLTQTASGWPDDPVCDLDRYLKRDDRMVLFDSAAIGARTGSLRTSVTNGVVTVTSEPRQIPHRQGGRRGRSRKHTRLAWKADIGAVTRPLRDWTDVQSALGERAHRITNAVAMGFVEYLLLDYSRAGRPATLALRVQPDTAGLPVLSSCECADTSVEARTLRAGRDAGELAQVRIAIVGLGAVGSFVADLLHRSGVRHLTLRDPELLRPGNVVRHLAEDAYVGLPKVEAVRRRLRSLALGEAKIDAIKSRISTLDDAVRLVQDHGVVVDATGSAPATSMLATAARMTGRTVVSVCIQRDGGVIRADRFPERGDEKHLLALATLHTTDLPSERGCGSLVSRIPPGAVVAAAELAVRAVIDEATLNCSLPATIADVRVAQDQPPFDRVGRVVAGPQTAEAT